MATDDDLSKYGEIFSTELMDELKESSDLARALIPIGEISPIMVNIPGVPAPDINVWQLCDGSEITNPDSPLRTIGGTQRFTPDLRGRYIKVASALGESGDLGGENDTELFNHAHGGKTGTFTSPEDVDQDNVLREAAFVHDHTIAEAFPDPVNVEPPFFVVKFYMRIQ